LPYTVTGEGATINLQPQSVNEEVLQNVAMILATPKFSVPLDRDLGMTNQFLDKPTPAAQALMIAEIVDAIEKYEPRATVEEVKFRQGSGEGALIPVVEVSINGG